MQLDDGWALEELPAGHIGEPERGNTVCAETGREEAVDDGWSLEDVPRATVVRAPGRVVIYPRSQFTPDQAHRAVRSAEFKKLWEWATS